MIGENVFDLVLLKVIFYFWPFLKAFWGIFFIFSRVLKQIQDVLRTYGCYGPKHLM